MSPNLIGRTVLFSLALAALAPAQQTTPFQFRLLLTQGTNTVLIQNGATLAFSAPIGQSQTAQVSGTYIGTGTVTLQALPPSVFASADFKTSIKTPQPITLVPGNTFAFDITFSPTSGALNSGQLFLPFVETLPPVTGTTPTQVQSSLVLSLQGTASSFTLSYVLPADQNVIPLSPGGSIVIPPTPINTIGQAALNVTNTGSGTGTVTGISITGAAFRLSRLPLFPVSVGAGQVLQVLVLYQPTSVTTDTGQVEVSFDVGPSVKINLQGSGSSSALVYQSLQTTPPTTLAPGDTLTFPGTNIGQSNSVAVRVINNGNASGTVSSISLAGQGYQLSNVPALPQVLAPNASLTFTVAFTPSQAAALNGSLLINSETINLKGVGLGAQLSFSYVAGGATVTLGPGNNSVVFSPVTISQSAQVNFDVKNTGTQTATISNIGVGQVNGPFSLLCVPALPVSLAPNEAFRLTINFTPTALGFSTGTLLLDNTSIALTGSGTQPPALPGYRITGASGTVAPAAQLSIGLSLTNTYPVAISGTLNLGVSSDPPVDPAVQFSTGGVSVPFVIAANSTVATFGNQGAQIGLQTGTVAGTITLTPTFATRAGGVDLTPATPTTLQITVAPAAPTLTSVQFSNQTANSVTIALSGFTTTRKLTAGSIQFTTAPGFDMPTSKFTIDVQQLAAAWFRSSAAQPFGSQFTISIPFTFQGTVPTGQTLLNSIASVAATISNEIGASNSIQVNVR